MLMASPGDTSGDAAARIRQGTHGMRDSELHELIGQLKSEIARLGPEDDEARARLRALVAEVEQRIDPAEEDTADEDLMERLRETVERFEVEHPRATGILNNIMVTLGSMGI
jgi:hypothetical protein